MPRGRGRGLDPDKATEISLIGTASRLHDEGRTPAEIIAGYLVQAGADPRTVAAEVDEVRKSAGGSAYSL